MQGLSRLGTQINCRAVQPAQCNYMSKDTTQACKRARVCTRICALICAIVS